MRENRTYGSEGGEASALPTLSQPDPTSERSPAPLDLPCYQRTAAEQVPRRFGSWTELDPLLVVARWSLCFQVSRESKSVSA